MKETICELYHDNFQNYKRYNIKKAQLVIADIPYNIGENAYGSNPQWYEGGDNKNGESKLAKSNFFNGDGQFNIAEYFHFFIKNYSSQVLKANMKIVGATEYAAVLYRDKLPKFNNGRQYDENGKIIRGSGKMIFNWFEWQRDNRKDYPKIHPTQKPVNVLKQLIEIFTDDGDTVIDPCAGSGSTLQAAYELGRNAYGFETNTKFYNEAKKKMPCFIR